MLVDNKKSNVTLLSPRVEIYVAVDSLNSRGTVVAYDIRGLRKRNVVTKNVFMLTQDPTSRVMT